MLLLPVAAASGWWAARRSARKQTRKFEGEANPVYFRGLNHLLNEEPDKAIDVFVEMLEVDSETVETHLALGNLFRRRGEVERAIRIHQNLIARPALTREQRAQALLELGKDYMRAGLFDRAENLFIELKDCRMYIVPALRNLIQIYQQTKDWHACLETAEQLEKATGENLSMERSHYYCELANAARIQTQTSEAQQYLKKAISVNRHCVRALHEMALLAAQQDDYKLALRHLTQAVQEDPAYLPEALPDLTRFSRSSGDLAETERRLTELTRDYPCRGAELYLADVIRERKGDSAAAEYLSDQLGKAPSLSGLIRMVELNARLPDCNAVSILNGMRDHLEKLQHDRCTYQCQKCGFQAKQLHWQCPSCRSWSTVKRKPLLESEG